MTVLRAGSASDVGRVRHSNQDLALEGPDLFAVADGMGGHAGGEVASTLAIETLRQAFARRPNAEGLREAISEANAAIWRRSLLDTELRGMGTTLTAAALVSDAEGDDVVVLANVGDSRAYLYSAGQMAQITADHSLAEEKVRQGELTEAEAAVHPHRHILTRALGVGPDVAVDLWEVRLQQGDRLLLCSDGLTNEVEDSQIAEVMAGVPEPGQAAQALVALANEHGGSDNITAVVVDVLAGDPDPGPGRTVAAAVGSALLGAAASGVPGELAGQPAGAEGAGPGAPGPGGAREGNGPGGAGDLTAAVPTVGPLGRGPGQGQRPAPAAGGPRGNGAPAANGTRVVVAPPVEPAGEGSDGWWARHRERRRRLRAAGIPRRITPRVVIFFLLVAAVFVGAYFFVRWYAQDNWYVTLKGDQLVVYQGRPGGLLWFQPKLVDRSGVTSADILANRVPPLRGDVEEPSLGAAKRYIANLKEEKLAQEEVNSGLAPGVTTTTTTTTTTTPVFGVTSPTSGGGAGETTTTSVVVPNSAGGG